MATESTAKSQLFDLRSASFFADPYPTFAELRQRHPLYWSEQWQRWVLTRYDDITMVLRDTRRFSSNVVPRLGSPAEKTEMAPFLRAMPRWLFFLDPPVHGPARAPYAPPFTASALAAIQPVIQRVVDELLDHVAAAGSMDAIWDFAFPLPATVLAEMLCPPEDRATLVEHARGLAWASANPLDALARQAGIRASVALAGYFRELIADRDQRRPGPLLRRFLASLQHSAAVDSKTRFCDTVPVGSAPRTENSEDDQSICNEPADSSAKRAPGLLTGGGLPSPQKSAGEGTGGTSVRSADPTPIARGDFDEPDLVSQCLLMLCAGNETTQHAIGNGLLALLSNPAQLHLFRDKFDAFPSAIDELLRYDSPVQSVNRIALIDVELQGQRIRKGDELVLLIAAANRDSARFDDPDRLDLARPGVAHLSFGYGNHYCLGATLARMEVSIALRTLLLRFPKIRLADKPHEWRAHDPALRGMRTLPVEWS